MQDIPYGYCQCGCKKQTKVAAKTDTRQGQRKGQPNRFLAGHRPPKHPDYVTEDRGYSTPCWIWQGSKDRDGYGLVFRGRRPMTAHGWYYTQSHGPIAADLELDHLCRVRECVNPEHLEAVTHEENVRRGMLHRPRQTHCKRGHEYTPENARTDASGARHCRMCERERSRAR